MKTFFYRWDLDCMLIALGVVLFFELLGVFTKRDYVTITYLIRTYIPKWIQAMIWGWLGWHFKLFGN